MNSKKRDVLITSSEVPVSAILNYGLFGALVTGYFFVRAASTQSTFCCGSGEPRDYFNTLPALLWIASALLAAVSLQVIYMIFRYDPIGDVTRFKTFGWLFGYSFLQALPFFLMAISQFALPNYIGTYFFLGVIALAFWLALRKYFGKYKLNFIALDVPVRVKIRRWIQGTFVAVCSFVILWLILPACACMDRSKSSSTKSNMHSFQTMVETYAIDWGGVYPPTIQALEKESKVRGREYWKDLINPCSGATGSAQTVIPTEQAHLLSSTDILGFRFDLERGRSRCMVLYRNTSLTSYEITGTDMNGRLLQNFDKAYSLSNG